MKILTGKQQQEIGQRLTAMTIIGQTMFVKLCDLQDTDRYDFIKSINDNISRIAKIVGGDELMIKVDASALKHELHRGAGDMAFEMASRQSMD